MQNHRGSQQRRQERRENKRVARALLTDSGALRAARERAMVEASPMANMPSTAWERAVWGLGDG